VKRRAAKKTTLKSPQKELPLPRPDAPRVFAKPVVAPPVIFFTWPDDDGMGS
jgi:hypothetical protein